MNGARVQVRRGEVWRTEDDGSWIAVGLIDKATAEGAPAKTWRAMTLGGRFLGCRYEQELHAVDEIVRAYEQRVAPRAAA